MHVIEIEKISLLETAGVTLFHVNMYSNIMDSLQVCFLVFKRSLKTSGITLLNPPNLLFD